MKCKEVYTDSYMCQTVGAEFIELISKCFNKPLFKYETKCLPINQDLEYDPT